MIPINSKCHSIASGTFLVIRLFFFIKIKFFSAFLVAKLKLTIVQRCTFFDFSKFINLYF